VDEVERDRERERQSGSGRSGRTWFEGTGLGLGREQERRRERPMLTSRRLTQQTRLVEAPISEGSENVNGKQSDRNERH
jgi:hypothetical protein